MGQRSVPAPFLTKTYKLVDDPATDDVVSWNEAGTTFVIWKTAEFSKDLLPNYFKHNNFSSFVRQLNTYGFPKMVPDKWEFTNENFNRHQKDLLVQIRRRKTVSTSAKPVGANNLASPASSGEDLGSSSTSSQASSQLADLSGENEKLKKDNQMLSSELAQTKIRCDQLIAFLTRHVNVDSDQISRIMNLGADSGEVAACGNSNCDDDENESCMKLFGVMVKKKRGYPGPHKKETKSSVPWMNISASPGESRRLCN